MAALTRCGGLAAVLASALLGGCMVGPHDLAAPPPVSGTFAGADPSAQRAPISAPVSRSADLGAWWRGFGDAELDSLIDRALAGNLDRQTAASRVREARQTARVARADLFPRVNGDASVTHTRISDNAGLSSITKLFGGGAGGGGGSPGGPSSAGAGFAGLQFDTYQLGLDANWDLDLFGGNKRAARAAGERAEAQIWSARDTDVVVTAEVARAYLQLRADQARLTVVRANATSQADLLNLVAARSRGGLTSEIDTVQQRSELASTQSQAAPLEAAVEAGVHQIGLLLGTAPDALAAELVAAPDPLAALPGSPPEVPVGLPSELLKRRPDIRQAERQLAASVDDVGRATAALYPSVSLTGSLSLVSTQLSTLFDGGSRNDSFAAQLMAPLFDAGRLRAQKRESEERSVQAGVAYRKAVFTGLKETADALSRYAADQRQFLILRSGLVDAQRAAELDRAQYLGGLAPLDSTLRAQATALQTQTQLVQVQGQLALDLVTLYRALGGGWSDDTARGPSADAGPSPHSDRRAATMLDSRLQGPAR